MTLSDYIDSIGTKKFAEVFDISQQHAWQLKELNHAPEPALAQKIVKETHGLVTWEEIYDPYLIAKQGDAKKARG